MSDKAPEVVIVGAGFAGLKVARQLGKAPVHVTLVDRHNYHLFQPLLYQVATAGLGPTDISQPVRAVLHKQENFDFRLAEVTGADLANRVLHTAGGDLAYDALVLAVGGETNFYNLDGVRQWAFPLKNLDDATRIRNHILYMFEQAVQEPDAETRRALLTFVVVGGGPTGVECAGALSELIRLVLVKDYPALNMKDVRIILLEMSDRLLNTFPSRLQEAAAKTLWQKYVEVRFGASVADFDGKAVTLKSTEIIPAHTMIWTAGVRAERLLDKLGLPQDRQGRVQVLPTLQAEGHPEVFVIGDAAHVPDAGGRPLPMVAQVALQEGALAAANIVRLLQGQPPQEFRYRDPGSMATIGRNAAVAQVGRLQLSGFLAWVMWLAVHIAFLIGFRNRLLVLINWAWDYFFYDRAVRLITHDGKCPWEQAFQELRYRSVKDGGPAAGGKGS